MTRDLSDASGSYYEATIERDAVGPSLEGRLSVDVAVVGGGYAGLSAALELATRGYSVALLEAKRVGWGASGRNGGQVLVGFAGEAAIERQLGRDDARRLWDMSVEAVKLVRDRITEFAIDCDYVEGHLTLATSPRKSDRLAAWAEHLATVYDYHLAKIRRDELADWVQSDRYLAGAFDSGSGHFHPLKYCLGLARACRAAGVRILENSPIASLATGREVLLSGQAGEVACRFAVLCGNAYLGAYGSIGGRLMRRILVVGSFMLATERLPDASLLRNRVAAADTNFILDYFSMTPDNRLLFGGADIFSAAAKSLDPAVPLRRQMLQAFPQLKQIKIDYTWGGVIDATINNAPDFGRLEPRVYYLQGFSGHGVALSNLAGKLVAQAIAGQAERFDLFGRLEHMQFPLHPMARRTAIALGVLYNRVKDAL